ncbi:MAG TPA: hypothetical protein VG248_03850 [Caulobacteraceae bacterium]|jgi:hypothetical protein|nr:hypothetical protein [Caulobacteraceae bacterium]
MIMRNLALAALAAAAMAGPAAAGPASDALASCAANAISPSDRQVLARWYFFALAQSPVVHADAAIPAQERVASETAMAALYERVMLGTCRTAAVAALRADGAAATARLYRTFGEAATFVLVTSPEGDAGLGSFTRRLDRSQFDALAMEAGFRSPAAAAPPPSPASRPR